MEQITRVTICCNLVTEIVLHLIFAPKIAKRVDLASLKSGFDKLDIDKLKALPVDLSKLSDVVKNEVVKKTEYD